MTRIDILVPSTFSWRPGQHCFLRFPSLSVFDNHPFTIASVPESESGRQSEKSQEMRTLSFFVRSHAGFTRKLSCYSSNNFDGSMRSWIDGPYGGVGRRIENEYDTIILIAGGSGITSCLPWLQYLAQRMDGCTVRTTNVKLLWVMRDPASLGWVSQELEELSRFATQGKVVMEFFVTGPHQPGEKLPLKIGKQEEDTGSDLWHTGRPDLTDHLSTLLTPTRRNIIIGKSSAQLMPNILSNLPITSTTTPFHPYPYLPTSI